MSTRTILRPLILVLCLLLFLTACGKDLAPVETPEIPETPAAETAEDRFEIAFSGKEADRPGYAEGTVLWTPKDGVPAGAYELFWGNAGGPLDSFYPVGECVTEETLTSLLFRIGENVMIPQKADRLMIAHTGETVAEAAIPQEKRLSGAPTVTFGSVADVHLNYVPGRDYWINALNEYEKLGAEFIIVAGDVTGEGGEYPDFIASTSESDYTGLVFMALGNHEQSQEGRMRFRKAAVYDGGAKKWISLGDGADYFGGEYAGDLDVRFHWDAPEGKNRSFYYYVTINDNLFFFMDQVLVHTYDSSNQDNFSEKQLDHLEETLKAYSGTHMPDETYGYERYNLFIVEHGLIRNLSSGDLFDGPYTQPILASEEYPNVMRFVGLLREYPESIWLSGHTHMGFGTTVDFVDRVYNENGALTDEPLARSVHNSSTSQPRWLENGEVIYSNTFENGSEGYLCRVYPDDVIFEAHCFKEFTPGTEELDPSLFCDRIYPGASYIMPSMTAEHP